MRFLTASKVKILLVMEWGLNLSMVKKGRRIKDLIQTNYPIS